MATQQLLVKVVKTVNDLIMAGVTGGMLQPDTIIIVKNGQGLKGRKNEYNME